MQVTSNRMSERNETTLQLSHCGFSPEPSTQHQGKINGIKKKTNKTISISNATWTCGSRKCFKVAYWNWQLSRLSLCSFVFSLPPVSEWYKGLITLFSLLLFDFSLRLPKCHCTVELPLPGFVKVCVCVFSPLSPFLLPFCVCFPQISLCCSELSWATGWNWQ